MENQWRNGVRCKKIHDRLLWDRYWVKDIRTDIENETDQDQDWPSCIIHNIESLHKFPLSSTCDIPVASYNKMLGNTCFSSFFRNDNNNNQTNHRYCIEVWNAFCIRCFNLSQTFTYRFIIISVWIFNLESFRTVERVPVIDRQIHASKIRNTCYVVTKGLCLSGCLIFFKSKYPHSYLDTGKSRDNLSLLIIANVNIDVFCNSIET